MLTSNSHGIKAAFLRTYKESGRRVAEPNSSNDGYLLHYSTMLPTDPTRAITKLHAYLIEGDLRQLWQQTKLRLKRQLQDARSVYKQPQSGSAAVPVRASAAELEHLYGSNGMLRVSFVPLCPCTLLLQGITLLLLVAVGVHPCLL